LHQRFVNILDGFNEVALAQDKINVVGLIDFYRRELHSVAPPEHADPIAKTESAETMSSHAIN